MFKCTDFFSLSPIFNVANQWINTKHIYLMTSWYGNAFSVTGALIGKQYIILTKSQWCEAWCFIVDSPMELLNGQSSCRWYETQGRSYDVCVLYSYATTDCTSCGRPRFVHDNRNISITQRSLNGTKFVPIAQVMLPLYTNGPVTIIA